MHMRPVGETSRSWKIPATIISVEAMREHYVRTADAWIANLEKRWDAAVELIGEEAARVWRLYLAG